MGETCSKYQITGRVEAGASNAYARKWPGRTLWTVRLWHKGHSLTLPFHTASGETPALDMVLETALKEADSVEWDSYASWLDDMGFEDSRAHQQMYSACEMLGKRLRRFLGDDYDALLYTA